MGLWSTDLLWTSIGRSNFFLVYNLLGLYIAKDDASKHYQRNDKRTKRQWSEMISKIENTKFICITIIDLLSPREYVTRSGETGNKFQWKCFWFYLYSFVWPIIPYAFNQKDANNKHIINNKDTESIDVVRSWLTHYIIVIHSTGRLRKIGTGHGLFIFGYFQHEISNPNKYP